jgi:hypothetical protein
VYKVAVAYSGDTDFNGSTSLLATLTGLADTTTILSVWATGLPG